METEVLTPLPQTLINIPCAECGESFAPSITKTKICTLCIKKKNDITEGIPKNLMLAWCRYCRRWCGPPWVLCDRESKELLGLCLKRISGLKKLKLVDAKFVWTEPHSRRTKLALTVQKDITTELTLQQSFEVEFYEIYTKCDDCKKLFTPHTWKAQVQVRQKVDNKKTFMLLEQMMLKSNVHRQCIKISAENYGMNFFFSCKNHAQKLVDFLNAAVPHINKESKELVSHDTNNNTYNYKYTFYFEMPKICKDDIVLLPKALCKEFGGVNSLAICYKVGTKVFLYDPISLRKYEMNVHQYFNYESQIGIIPFKNNETEFMVTDIYQDKDKTFDVNATFADIQARFAHVDLVRLSDMQPFTCTTHLGHILKHGDTAIGYDIGSLNANQELTHLDKQKFLPDVILIRKTYPQKVKQNRIWKVKRMKMDEESVVEEKKGKKNQEDNVNKDMEDFMDEIEQDKYLRAKINLYVNDDVVEKIKDDKDGEDRSDEMVKLEELMKDLKIEEEEALDIDDFVDALDKINLENKE